YGPKKLGSLFSFLFIWQTIIQAPLVIASGCIGFAAYLNYFIPNYQIVDLLIIPNSYIGFNITSNSLVSGGLVILLSIILYRKITFVGKISIFLWVIVLGTIFWIIFAGFTHFNPGLAFHYPPHSLELGPVFFAGLGMASMSTVYSYLGYYNVCHLGAEIKNPAKNIPRSIYISIIGIAILYIAM